MTTDDRLTRYLSDQADSISLAPADPAGVMRRGARRRARRRAGFAGGLAVVAVLATTLAVRDPDPGQQVDMAAAPNVATSTYDWSTVAPDQGLGYGERTAQLADGSIFGISTAPGPYDPDDWEASVVPSLYRSTDGAEWETATLPTGLRTADIAGAGDTLYSVGTAPAGGVVVAASGDGARSWTSTSLDDGLSSLKERHGARIALGQVRIAATDASHLVVAATAATSTDLGLYLPEYQGGHYAWAWDDTGVTVYEPEAVRCEAAALEAAGEAGPADAAGCLVERADGSAGPGEEVARHTYEELGITGELRDHVGGRVYVYVTEDGTDFERVDVPTDLDVEGWVGVATPLATADGYRLVIPSYAPEGSKTEVLRSADGRTWEHAATIPGGAHGVGLLAGRPAMGIWDDQGQSHLAVEQPGGTWSDVDLSGAVVAPEGAEVSIGGMTFGPLGVAAVLTTIDPEDGQVIEQHVIHSGDGSMLEVRSLSDLVDDGLAVTGAVVSADAIALRFSEADGDVRTPPTQTVLVGTPTG